LIRDNLLIKVRPTNGTHVEEFSVKRTVISLGGSILVRGSEDAEFLSGIAGIL
jgi:hypothetical protein